MPLTAEMTPEPLYKKTTDIKKALMFTAMEEKTLKNPTGIYSH